MNVALGKSLVRIIALLLLLLPPHLHSAVIAATCERVWLLSVKVNCPDPLLMSLPLPHNLPSIEVPKVNLTVNNIQNDKTTSRTMH